MKLPEVQLMLMATEQAMQQDRWPEAAHSFVLQVLDACPSHPWLFLDWSSEGLQARGVPVEEAVISQSLLKLAAFMPNDAADGLPLLTSPATANKRSLDANDLACSPLVHQGQVRAALVHPGRAEAEEAAFYACLERCFKLLYLHFAQLDTFRDRDALTGLYNRKVFDRTLQQAIDLHQRHAVPFCLALLDVDAFKELNDSRGHAAGDAGLQSLAAFLQAGTRGTDTVCRIGGDEFGIILPYANPAAGTFFAERMFAGLQTLEDGLSVSMGMTSSSEDAQDRATLFNTADQALYAAKTAGGGRFIFRPGTAD